jgi:drug/metabolite transporter (DMT)-like permease
MVARLAATGLCEPVTSAAVNLPDDSHRPWIGPAAAVGAAVLYGTSWVATGLALRGFTPFALAAWRSLVTVLILIPILWWVTRASPDAAPSASTQPARSGWLLRLFMLGSLGGAFFGIGMNVSIMLTGAAITAFIAGAYPVLAAAAAPLVLGEPLRLTAVAGLVVAFVGVLLIAGFDVAGVRLDGALIAGLTAVAVAAFMLLSRRWQRPWGIRPTQITLSNFGLLGLSGLLLALANGDPLLKPEAGLEAWLAVLWLGLFAGAVATILLTESHRRLPASEGSAYLMLNPLTAAVLAVPVLGESFSAVQWAGAALVLVGIGLATGTFRMISRVLGLRR